MPDTLNRWRRKLVSRKGSNCRRPGRPPIDPAVRELILRMAKENARWGYLRIKGELIKLGIRASATTIANVLRRSGLGPSPRRIGPTWSQFLRAQALAILATGGAPGSGQEDRGPASAGPDASGPG
ncbi:MAG TPA: helix-turn-helix domain-containing protein [Actinomycetota bacterium]|nr:helix-turn-helix domain-containing protein [Actinomycetota bacterium]